MSRKLIITESEKNNIKSLYNIKEDSESFADGILDLVFNPKNTQTTDNKDVETTNDTTKDSGKPLKISDSGQKLLQNPTFKKKLKEISDAIHIGEDTIIKLMNHESGLNPSIKNGIGCVGLIQFCPDNGGGSTKTVGGKKYSLDDLKNDLELQMDVIKQFWLEGYKNGKIKKPADLYIYNFFPVAAGKGDDFVLKTNSMSAEKIASSNPVFNKKLGKGKYEPLTVGDLNKYYKQTGMV